MALLNLLSLATTPLHREPYLWGVNYSTFSNPRIADQLAHSFPIGEYRNIARRDRDKAYSMRGLHITDTDSWPPLWSALFIELKSDAYRGALATTSGISLTDLNLELTLWDNRPGHFLAPHTDKKDKVLSHIFYFTDAEVPADGALRILRGPSFEPDAVAMTIAMSVGTSVYIVRADNSWHGYPPIQSTPRRSLQVTFHHPQLRYRSSLR